MSNEINPIREGQNKRGSVPRNNGACVFDFHYDTAEFDRFDKRSDYDYTWIDNPVNSVPGLVVTRVEVYRYTWDKSLRKCHYSHLQKVLLLWAQSLEIVIAIWVGMLRIQWNGGNRSTWWKV
ncbi:MAG: hypothetical protein J7J76_05805 [Candidatus Latescibacteria bacterium]|nr:hypothetical protein [Candidatus Latescibacterota bacterium]